MTGSITTTETIIPSISKPETLKAFAVELKTFIVSQNLYTPIQGKNYVNVEGWQFAGGSLGLTALVESCERLERGEDEITYRSQVTVYSGERVVSRAFSICSNKEAKKKTFDEYAIESMSQTRATGKAYRLLLGWLMKMAGYEATPTEEMEGTEQAQRGTDIPAYCADCGMKMDLYVKGPKKGTYHCKGKTGLDKTCPPKQMTESEKMIDDEINAIPVITVEQMEAQKVEEQLKQVGF